MSQALLVRDCHGFTPLHSAAACSSNSSSNRPSAHAMLHMIAACPASCATALGSPGQDYAPTELGRADGRVQPFSRLSLCGAHA